MASIFLVGGLAADAELLCCALGAAGFFAADFDGESDFLGALDSASPDLILMDGRLCSSFLGIDLFEKLQRRSPGFPILFFGGEEEDVLLLQERFPGADCQWGQAFPVSDLIATIRETLLWHAKKQQAEAGFFRESFSLLPDSLADGDALTQKESALLAYLLSHKGVALSRQELLNKIWGHAYTGQHRTVDTHIKTLRRKLSDSALHIETVRGAGYRLEE